MKKTGRPSKYDSGMSSKIVDPKVNNTVNACLGLNPVLHSKAFAIVCCNAI
jgi:hypothetical protein